MLDTFHDHLNAQQAGGGSRKNKKLDLTVSVNSVHSHSQDKKCKKYGIVFLPDKAYYVICDNCHQSKIQGKLELTDDVKKKFGDKKRLKEKYRQIEEERREQHYSVTQEHLCKCG
jgi:hypothetical protein